MNDVSISDDYAVLTCTNIGFYYGYEYEQKETSDGDTEEVWGFEVNDNNGRCYGLSYEEMSKFKNCPKQWDCAECLLFGISLYINKLGI